MSQSIAIHPRQGTRGIRNSGRASLVLSGCVLACVSAFAAHAHAAPVILYPVDGTAVASSHLEILGGITSKAEVVKIKVNGKLTLPFIGRSHSFLENVTVVPGPNTIEVADEVIRVHYTTREFPTPEGFITRYLHPAAEKACDGCHDKERPGVFTAKTPSGELCAKCHGDLGLGPDKNPYAHGHSPIADDSDCLSCHSPHVGETRQMLVKPVPALCYECHDPPTKGQSGVHEPVASGDCASCHAPHGSAVKGMLRKPSETLCLDCHDDPAAGLPVAHEGTADGCLACHVAHASDQKSLLATNQVALCGQCHDTPPAGQDITVHSPIADDRQCTACHLPHASRAPRLLLKKEPELCLECHDDPSAPGKKGGSIHSPVADGGCSDCHSPHFGPGALLKSKVPGLCTECHDGFSKPEKGSLHSPVADGDCGACHLPHSSQKRDLLKAEGSALCLDCHDAFVKPEKGSLHDPVASGDCSDCHLPHSAPSGKLLAKAGAALCYDCHDRFVGQVQHSPVADEDCAGCHRPHSATAPKLLSARGMALCLECHDNPAAEAADREKGSVHSPIGDDKECTPCHLPHAGGKNLLRAAVPALCYECHDDVSKKGDKALAQIHPPVADGACFDCHRPHASSSPALAGKDPRGALCLECHDNPAMAKGGIPVKTPHPPVAEDCGKCHVPHAGDVSAMLKAEKDSLCSECHPKHQHPLIASVSDMAQVPAGFPMDSQRKMRCGGCHLSHGSDYPDLWFSERQAFCGKCHKIF